MAQVSGRVALVACHQCVNLRSCEHLYQATSATRPRDGDELVVRDLGSLNGTRINGRRLEEG
jgi:hypothetical protein